MASEALVVDEPCFDYNWSFNLKWKFKIGLRLPLIDHQNLRLNIGTGEESYVVYHAI